MAAVQDVIEKFSALDSSIKATFPKTEPLLVVSLIFDNRANRNDIYTVEIMLKPGQDTEAIRQRVVEKTGMSPGFYLRGTKMIVSHTLDLDFLKWINEQDGIVSIKGSKYSAGGATDF